MRFDPIDWIQNCWMGLVVMGFMLGCLILDRSELYLTDKTNPLNKDEEAVCCL